MNICLRLHVEKNIMRIKKYYVDFKAEGKAEGNFDKQTTDSFKDHNKNSIFKTESETITLDHDTEIGIIHKNILQKDTLYEPMPTFSPFQLMPTEQPENKKRKNTEEAHTEEKIASLKKESFYPLHSLIITDGVMHVDLYDTTEDPLPYFITKEYLKLNKTILKMSNPKLSQAQNAQSINLNKLSKLTYDPINQTIIYNKSKDICQKIIFNRYSFDMPYLIEIEMIDENKKSYAVWQFIIKKISQPIFSWVQFRFPYQKEETKNKVQANFNGMGMRMFRGKQLLNLKVKKEL